MPLWSGVHFPMNDHVWRLAELTRNTSEARNWFWQSSLGHRVIGSLIFKRNLAAARTHPSTRVDLNKVNGHGGSRKLRAVHRASGSQLRVERSGTSRRPDHQTAWLLILREPWIVQHYADDGAHVKVQLCFSIECRECSCRGPQVIIILRLKRRVVFGG